MPESFLSPPEVRCGVLEHFFASQRAALETSNSECHGRKGRGKHESAEQSSGSKKPGSSRYYGVRFRTDLKKWVAEIRVAEWKAVDKKVWLGTFDSERGAARGVDLARKLLRCRKKHGYNLPCRELDAYQGHIPDHLVLSDVTATTMFKDATRFIKRECQVYAASFPDDSDSGPDMDDDHELPFSDDPASISVDDYLADGDPYLTVPAGSSPSSSTSSIDQQWTEAPWIAEFGDSAGTVATGIIPGGLQAGWQGPVSQDCWDVPCSWPGAASSSALPPWPGSYPETMSYPPYFEGPSMDCDDFSLQNFHNYPFQHGPTTTWY